MAIAVCAKVYKRRFFIIPAVVYQWLDCKCYKVEIVWGNISLIIIKSCPGTYWLLTDALIEKPLDGVTMCSQIVVEEEGNV